MATIVPLVAVSSVTARELVLSATGLSLTAAIATSTVFVEKLVPSDTITSILSDPFASAFGV